MAEFFMAVREQYKQELLKQDDERGTRNMVLEGDSMTLPHPSAQPPQPSYLAGAWEAFYEGDFQWATRNVAAHARTLERFVEEAPHSWQTTVKMLIQLYNLAGTSARDRMDTQVCLGYFTRAKQEAEAFGDIDLLVTTLIQLFHASIQFGLYCEAECMKDLMLVWGGSLRDVALMGLIYQCAGELYSTLSVREHSQEYATYALKYLDHAEDAWATIGRDSTTNHMRFTFTSVLNERATFLASQGRVADAERALDRAQQHLAGSNIRHKKDYYLALSGLNLANENVLGACAALSSSLNLHEETNSRSNFVYMFRDVAKLKKMAPENNAVLLIENRLRTL